MKKCVRKYLGKHHMIYYIMGCFFTLCIIKLKAQIQTPIPEKIYIPLIVKSQDRFWEVVRIGAERAASDYRLQISFEGPPSEKDIDMQGQLIEEAINRNPQAIAIAAIDMKGASPYVEMAASRGISVVAFDSAIDSELVKTTVSTNNYAAGKLAAEKMAKLIHNKGKVAIIVPDNTSATSINRRDGFIDTISQSYPDIEIVSVKYGEDDVQKSAQAVREILEDHPDIKGIFAANEGSSKGLVTAARELNLNGDEIKLIAFDSGTLLTEAIKDGVVAGAITQDPITMGYLAVVSAYQAYKGESLPEKIETGFRWYDRSNMDNPDIRSLLYE